MLITIDCGIGQLIFREPENLKLKMLCDALKDHIEIYGVDKISVFLSNEEGMEDLKSTIADLENELELKEDAISELESDLESMDDNTTTIDCGIGEINYEVTGSMVLTDVMENLETAIKKTTPKKVNEVLSAI